MRQLGLERHAIEIGPAHLKIADQISATEEKISDAVMTQIPLERLSDNSAFAVASCEEETREIGVVNHDGMSWALSIFSTDNITTNEQLSQLLQEAEDNSESTYDEESARVWADGYKFPQSFIDSVPQSGAVVFCNDGYTKDEEIIE